jgi:sensor histidine kinase regulating citrate/malate metabolism
MHTTQMKIVAALLMVSIIALTTTATLAYFIYERTLSGLVLSRFEFIATELKRKVEAGLDLGLPLGELENVNDLLRQEISTDKALVRLSIENARGITVFDTDTSRIGTKSSLNSPVQAEPKGSDVLVREPQIRVPLVNSFGKVVGGLLVEYSKDYYDSKRARTIRNVAEATLIVLLLSGFIGTCGVLVISR